MVSQPNPEFSKLASFLLLPSLQYGREFSIPLQMYYIHLAIPTSLLRMDTFLLHIVATLLANAYSTQQMLSIAIDSSIGKDWSI